MSSVAPPALLLEQVQLLEGPDQPPVVTTVLLEAGAFSAQGETARQRGAALGLTPLQAEGWWLAPCLIDPHSQLEAPWLGTAETLASLERSAIAAGYGSVALLPKAQDWRDRPDRLQPLGSAAGLQWLLWGSFSRGGEGQELAGHGDQLAAGAVGLAEGENAPPLALLERGLSLGECGRAPLLLAPRDPALSHHGFVREGVETLRAGWPPDPVVSETVPLRGLLALAQHHPGVRLQLMNLSTAAAVELLAPLPPQGRPEATVCWWHLLADSAGLDPLAEGWRMVPPLGNGADRL
ncbi:MAG: dihydroorotase, partial [Vulcanococcus sp.]